MARARTASQAVAAHVEERDDGYQQFQDLIYYRVGNLPQNVFTTDATDSDLWQLFIGNIPAARRQHYNCHCCRRFIQRYGGLVSIEPGTGVTSSVLWQPQGMPEFFKRSLVALRNYVEKKCKVTGVFLWSEAGDGRRWGSESTPDLKRNVDWAHLHGDAPQSAPYLRTQTAEQAMAEKKEDYEVLTRSLQEYHAGFAQRALGLLSPPSTLYRDEKALEAARWFCKVHDSVKRYRIGGVRHNLIWLAVAQAPPGFCHVRNNVIGTLLQDIKDGLAHDEIKRRWDAKMHPLRYQRPTAPQTRLNGPWR